VPRSLEEVLGYVALGRIITSVRPGIPDPLPPQFRDREGTFGIRRPYRGKSVRYLKVKGQRRTALRTEYGSPAVRRVQLPLDEAQANMLHSFHELEPFDWLLMQRLRAYESYEQRGAEEEVTRQMAGFADLFENLEIATTNMAVGNGLIYFDQNGNLLPTSAGATLIVDYGIPAANKGQVSGIIGLSWADPNALIDEDVRMLKLQVVQKTGYELRYAFYGSNIPGYLFRNTQLQNYFVRNPEINQRFVSSNEIGNFLDLQWIPAYKAFFVDQTETIQQTWPADQVSFWPEIGPENYEFLAGSYGVPRSFGPTVSAAAAMGQIEEVFGRFAYAVPMHNPPSVTAFAGNTWLPLPKVPESIIIADVVP
jgi:hypothetical protein